MLQELVTITRYGMSETSLTASIAGIPPPVSSSIHPIHLWFTAQMRAFKVY
jgi:hypothetical protein